MKKILVGVNFIGMILLLSSCVYANSEGIQKEKYELASFDKVKVSAGIQIFLTQGSENTAIIEADGSVIDNVLIDNSNGVLEISLEKSSWNLFRRNKGKIKVYLTFSNLAEVSASSGSRVYSQNVLELDKFDLSVSSGAYASLTISAVQVNLASSSGANVEIEGAAQHVSAKVSSGADINAKDLVAQTGDGSASSGGSLAIYIDGEVDASASSGGSVDIFGDSVLKNINMNSGGSINKR